MTEHDSKPEAAEENPLNESSAHRIIFFFEKKKDNTQQQKNFLELLGSSGSDPEG